MPWLQARRADECAECGDEIKVGDPIFYNGQAYCTVCGTEVERHERETTAASSRSRAVLFRRKYQ